MKLYGAYARKILRQKKFWTDLSKSEEVHVRMLHEIGKRYRGEENLFKTSKHLENIVGYIGRFIDAELEKTKTGKISQKSALETALRIEQSMIEKKCFEIIQPEKAEILEVFRKLNQETDGHYQSLLKNYKNCP